jgi:type II secretory pathway predicted ATPase ExeA
MLPEYLKYWGLIRPPFSLTPDPEMLYMSRQHQEGLIRLKYAVVSNKGGALLISENAGDGKTSLLAKLRTELAEYYQGKCRMVFIDHPTLTANQMVGEIARQLGVGCTTTDKLTLLNELRTFLLERHEQGEKCVVMLDEGQMLCHRPDLLQELRILLNFCVSDAFLLTFILSGQKPLDEAIRAMPEFYQRLPVRFFLRNLEMEDTCELIRHRLQVAGCEQGREIFGEDGYAGIFNHSKGCPRVICSVADLSLVIAHSHFSDKVDFVSVSQATSDMNRTDGAYHYFHFLNSFQETEKVIGPQMDLSQLLALSCPACTGKFSPESSFCPHCGYALKGAHDAEAAAQETVVKPLAPAAKPAITGQQGMVPPINEETEATLTQNAPAPEVKKTQKPSKQAKFSLDEDVSDYPGAKLQRAIRFILDGDGDKSDTPEKEVEQTVEQPAEDSKAEESAGDAQSVPVEDLREQPPETPAVDITQLEINPEDRLIDDHVETPVEPEPEVAELAPGMIKCSFCGLELTPKTAECPNCGEALESEFAADDDDDQPEQAEEELQPAPEQELLDGLKALKLDKYMPVGNGALLRLPCHRFLGRSPVVQFVSRDADKFFTTRCGLRIGRDDLLFEMGGDTDSLAYEVIERISTDTISNDSTVLLGQLVIAARGGIYRLTLPFKADTGGRLAALLQNYIGGRMPVTGASTKDESNLTGAEDSNGNGHS